MYYYTEHHYCSLIFKSTHLPIVFYLMNEKLPPPTGRFIIFVLINNQSINGVDRIELKKKMKLFVYGPIVCVCEFLVIIQYRFIYMIADYNIIIYSLVSNIYIVNFRILCTPIGFGDALK